MTNLKGRYQFSATMILIAFTVQLDLTRLTHWMYSLRKIGLNSTAYIIFTFQNSLHGLSPKLYIPFLQKKGLIILLGVRDKLFIRQVHMREKGEKFAKQAWLIKKWKRKIDVDCTSSAFYLKTAFQTSFPLYFEESRRSS